MLDSLCVFGVRMVELWWVWFINQRYVNVTCTILLCATVAIREISASMMRRYSTRRE